MGNSHAEAKRAVEAGYWNLYRYNPLLKEKGENPFVLDSKAPTGSFREFLMGEVRYSLLMKKFPEQAEALFVKTEQDAMDRLEQYRRLAGQMSAALTPDNARKKPAKETECGQRAAAD
jgi:pyruvate-ferredoxin/flavodoxin oxidoreductase